MNDSNLINQNLNRCKCIFDLNTYYSHVYFCLTQGAHRQPGHAGRSTWSRRLTSLPSENGLISAYQGK